jgi:hypothetical protein
MSKIFFEDFEDFTPDFTPIEILKLGSFGGTYFYNIKIIEPWNTVVPDVFYKLVLEQLSPKLYVNIKYNTLYNKHKVKCGSNYDEWLYSGWIRYQDPYGWYNWYVNFYYGRRSVDDIRQISRWFSFKARHSAMYIKFPNSKKTMQNLLHWGINYDKIKK